MRILDSRRLTGTNPWLDAPGAILDVSLDGLDPGLAITAWTAHAHRLLDEVGWPSVPVARRHAGGASLAIRAPLDALYSATELNEAAWYAAVAELGGVPAAIGWTNLPDGAPYAPTAGGAALPEAPAIAAWLRARIAFERKPGLNTLAEHAEVRGLTLLADDEFVSIGLGAGSRTWPMTGPLPAAADVPWSELSDVPVALVTGTNGKSTSVRLIAAMAGAAGAVAGATTTDRVTVGDEVIAVGDFSGPNGARAVLRDRRVGMAVLELARGGILRRGLAVRRAAAALVTNVANDHLGEYGIYDLPALADVKLTVAKAVGPDGRVVLDADDPLLRERGVRLAAPVTWFTLMGGDPMVRAHVAGGGDAVWLEHDTLMLAQAGRRSAIARVADVPIALGGLARHNVANALGAIGVAAALGLPVAAMTAGVTGFEASPAMNPGRTNIWDFEGLRVIVDYAHNPHGLRAIARMVRDMPALRRGLVLGQAGDRDDDAIRELVREAWRMTPSRVFLKDMEPFLRGRAPGAVPELMQRALLQLGARLDQIERHDSELGAVGAALAWADHGDLLLVTTHVDRERVIGWLEHLARTGWKPGQELTAPEPA